MLRPVFCQRNSQRGPACISPERCTLNLLLTLQRRLNDHASHLKKVGRAYANIGDLTFSDLLEALHATLLADHRFAALRNDSKLACVLGLYVYFNAGGARLATDLLSRWRAVSSWCCGCCGNLPVIDSLRVCVGMPFMAHIIMMDAARPNLDGDLQEVMTFFLASRPILCRHSPTRLGCCAVKRCIPSSARRRPGPIPRCNTMLEWGTRSRSPNWTRSLELPAPSPSSHGS